MIRFITIVFLISIIIGCKNNTSEYCVIFFNKAPVIDAKKDDAWTKCPVSRIENECICELCNESSKDHSAQFQAGWDNNNLYFYINIVDDIKFRNNLPKTESEKTLWASWKNDDVELFFDMNNDKEKSIDLSKDDFRYDFVYDYDSIVSTNNIHNIKFAQTNTIVGWAIEIAIPWENLNYDPAKGKIFGFEMNLSDNDCQNLEQGIISNAQSKLCWSEKGQNNAHKWTKVYGIFKLINEKY